MLWSQWEEWQEKDGTGGRSGFFRRRNKGKKTCSQLETCFFFAHSLSLSGSLLCWFCSRIDTSAATIGIQGDKWQHLPPLKKCASTHIHRLTVIRRMHVHTQNILRQLLEILATWRGLQLDCNCPSHERAAHQSHTCTQIHIALTQPPTSNPNPLPQRHSKLFCVSRAIVQQIPLGCVYTALLTNQ